MATETRAAVKRKLNITWDDDGTDARVDDVISTVTPWLASRLGYEPGHAFTEEDGPAWGLFLSACLYEFSDAMDDFLDYYAEEISCTRAIVTASAGEASGGSQAQG